MTSVSETPKRAASLDALTRYALAATLVVLCLFFAIATQDHVFVKPGNLINIANQSAINTIIAVGMTLVIVTGGIDLGVGSIVALAGVLCAGIMAGGLGLTLGPYRIELIPKVGGPMVAVMGLAAAGVVGVVAGLVNAAAIVRFRITPFIATLAMMLMARGAASLYSVSPIRSLPEPFIWIGQGGRLAGVPIPVYIAAAAAALGWLLLARSTIGRHVYAVGGNEEAARLSGIPVGRIKTLVYAGCGLCAALAGAVLASQLGAGDCKVGQGFELDAIAAAVLGGTSLMGGRGTIVGTVLGALIIGVLDNGLTILGVSSFTQMILKGLVILGAVILDQLREKR